jgi:hypothetical protein
MAGELIGRGVPTELLRRGHEIEIELEPDELTD